MVTIDNSNLFYLIYLVFIIFYIEKSCLILIFNLKIKCN